ncbi:hypothetical protein [Pseudomonas aeruginosa]|uniref:hypothetical protein n=1 Tax=Pseudomonas aeruginosa TaxID=287 RepID=UPI001A3436CD|nr:hypothetical protein [Pseudomonas aeruginosa]MBH9126117.1 hypothetical protein [Pseudomonas aeruginosa]MBH9162191.1 hypothetical protein [Pseudomonas aeruginosa]MBI8743347.1 hypothetical protein [Pseudomonas aeruginosa]
MLNLDAPRDRDVHTIADFAEILCLVTQDRVCSRETISDQIRDVGGSKISDHELDDCFNHIAWRVEAFGGSYPFSLDAGRRTISAPEVLPEEHKLYVLILLCANLPFIDRGYMDGSLPDAFERVSLITLRSIFPVAAQVKAFGKKETEYKGAKWDRINQLAKDIGGVGLCDEKTFRVRDSGDGGIDLVAWLSLDEYERRNIPSALAQCACSRSDWPRKQSEISHGRLRYIHVAHPWMQLIFIPHSFRDNGGAWAVEGEVGDTLIFDRLRIVKNIKFEDDWRNIDPPAILENFLEKRLDLV